MADELTLKEALLDIVGGLKDPKQWKDTYEGLRRTRDAIPGVAESYIRGGLSQVAGQYGDLRDLATATSEFIPEKLRKVTSIAQFLSNPYLQTAINRAPTSEQVLEATPRITPEHEGAKDVEMMGGWTAPGGAGVIRDLAKVTKGMPIGAMMIGPESALWKQEMEFAARKLEAKKASPEQIYEATGLVRGLDKEWRSELGDQFSKMTGKGRSFGEHYMEAKDIDPWSVYMSKAEKEKYGRSPPELHKMTTKEFQNYKDYRSQKLDEYNVLETSPVTVKDVFKHDDLLKAYPEIGDIKIESSGSPHFNGAFSMVDGKPVIKLNESLTPEQARSTMLHELQHYIQRKENWGTGGNTGSYTQQDDARIAQSALSLRQEAERMDNSIPFEQRVEQASDMLNRLTSSDKFGGDVKKVALDIATNPTKELKNMGVLYGTDKNIEPYSPRKMYELMGGEAEARLIQERRDLSEAERMAHFPYRFSPNKYNDNLEKLPNYGLDIKPEQAIIHGREPGVIEVGGKRISGEPVPGIEGSIDLEKIPTREEFEEVAKKGQMRQARTQEQDLKDILAGKMPANRFDLAGSYDDLAVDYESGTFVKRLKDAGLHVYDDKFGTVYVGKTPKDLKFIKNAESPLESGLSYGYAPEDIAKFYSQRRGGNTDLGYQEYLRDLRNYQEKAKPVEDYRGVHTAPAANDYNAPGHELNRIYPDDIYGPKGHQYYGHGEGKMDRDTMQILNELRGNPEAPLTIYRSVPNNLGDIEINPGDWVTPNLDYAHMHGARFDEGYRVLERQVPAKHIWTDANSIHEFGYDPTEK